MQCSRQFIAKWGWVVSWMYFAVEHLQCDRMTSQQQGRNPLPSFLFLLIHRFFAFRFHIHTPSSLLSTFWRPKHSSVSSSFHTFAYFTCFTSHQFLFYPTSQCPATRQHRFIFAFICIPCTYIRVHTSQIIYSHLYTHVFSFWLQCAATRASDQAETIDSTLVGFSDQIESYFNSQCKGWAGKADWFQLLWRHPALRLNFPLQNIFPVLLQNVTEKVQLN